VVLVLVLVGVVVVLVEEVEEVVVVLAVLLIAVEVVVVVVGLVSCDEVVGVIPLSRKGSGYHKGIRTTPCLHIYIPRGVVCVYVYT